MDKNLDEIFDLIIAGESKRIISISNGVKVEKSPSYFRDMKRMYSKSLDTMYNPNNVFIPYILVSIEFILRQLVDVDITVSTKAPTAKELLDALTGKKRALATTEDDFIYHIGKQLEGNKMQILGYAKSDSDIPKIKEYLISNGQLADSEIIISKFNKNGYIKNLYEILSSIREKYYDEIPEFGNSYRNLVMHANRFLLLEKDDMFEELLTDYSKLINSVWGDAVMPYDKKRVLEKDPKSPWYVKKE